MQKVISALEHLELLVQNSEAEMETIEDLRKTIEHLEHEDNKKADERLKYARDIEQVEEHYKVRIRFFLSSQIILLGGDQRLLDNNQKTSGGEQEVVQLTHSRHGEGQRLLRG